MCGRSPCGPNARSCDRLLLLPPEIFSEVVSCFGRPSELVRFGVLVSRFVSEFSRHMLPRHWERLYEQRWPAFHECLGQRGPCDWRLLYRETLAGRCECTLEVFEREKRAGFAMSALPAHVAWMPTAGAYVARYLSASEVLPETIPPSEEHRLRACPASVRGRLRPGREPLPEQDAAAGEAVDPAAEGDAHYPYRVLDGVPDVEVGQGVEVQWKMQVRSPYGWWFGTLEALERSPDGKQATARISFRHFNPRSPWYSLTVCFGDGRMRPAVGGGYTGGLRAVAKAEQRRWMRFFPASLLLI